MKFENLKGYAPLISAAASVLSVIVAISALIATATNARNTRLAVDIQQAAMRPAMRPLGWSFAQDGARGQIRFDRLQNEGDGPARYVAALFAAKYPGETQRPDGFIFGAIEGTRVERIDARKSAEVNFYGEFPWPNATECNKVYLEVQVLATDARGTRWQTTYGLLAFKKPRTRCIAAMKEVAPNLHYVGIVTDGPFEPGASAWVLWLTSALLMIPLAFTGWFTIVRWRGRRKSVHDDSG